MHIPDNYLSPATCAVLGAAMVPVWAISVKKVKGEVEKAKLPLLGIGAAFSFLVMMFNVPLPGGTTGHAVGATLIAALVGPWAACISVSVALLIQALLFGDGGILAFGANCFNMAFVIPFLGYFIYEFIAGRTKDRKVELFGLGLASYLALICLSPLGLLASGTAWGEWGADEIKDIVHGGAALGFTPAGMEKGFSFNALFPDYAMAGLPEWLGYLLSAVAGAAILVIVFKLIAAGKTRNGIDGSGKAAGK
jgi:cobalamin biosynthesis protein CbiM